MALLVAGITALAAALTAGVWASTRTPGWTHGSMMGSRQDTGIMSGNAMMGGAGMMGGTYGAAGDGRRVESVDAATARAGVLADRLALRVGEVMQFSNGFYVELTTADGHAATEVLVDAADGSVIVEYGPAMMWNTSYGMHAGAAAAPRVSATEATTIAQRWLDGQRPGLFAGEAEAFPGYFTLHSLRDGNIVGMMSINAYTGAVWYHTWHGQFIAMSRE